MKANFSRCSNNYSCQTVTDGICIIPITHICSFTIPANNCRSPVDNMCANILTNSMTCANDDINKNCISLGLNQCRDPLTSICLTIPVSSCADPNNYNNCLNVTTSTD
jgi:hypothetical protein